MSLFINGFDSQVNYGAQSARGLDGKTKTVAKTPVPFRKNEVKHENHYTDGKYDGFAEYKDLNGDGQFTSNEIIKVVREYKNEDGTRDVITSYADERKADGLEKYSVTQVFTATGKKIKEERYDNDTDKLKKDAAKGDSEAEFFLHEITMENIANREFYN